MAERRKWHGPQLDAAMKVAEAGPQQMADDFGVCLTALETRIHSVIEQQLEYGVSEEALALAREALRAAGEPVTQDSVDVLTLRTAIGGSFSFGLHVGLVLAGMEQRLAGEASDA